jgi:hypothetical protein
MQGNNKGSIASIHKSEDVVSVLASGTSASPKNARDLTPRCEGLNTVPQVTLTTIDWPAWRCYFSYCLISYLKFYLLSLISYLFPFWKRTLFPILSFTDVEKNRLNN